MIAVMDFQKKYGNEIVLDGVNFVLEKGKTLCVTGASGSGKSTLLRLLAGWESPDAGDFRIAGKSMLHIPPSQRKVVYLSQEPLLFPHLSVAKNLSYGLEIRRLPGKVVRERVGELAQRLGLDAQLHKMPDQLSGGQKQRVSFGRSLIIEPEIFLLDEPFASLDHQTREEMQVLFGELRLTFSMTTIFVTHDIKEALMTADQLATLKGGKLTVFDQVQDFLASPESGARKELDFWTRIQQLQQHEPQQ
ncbi:MAG: ABC transporter ATP-binding protein [Saprospiraceae bacterium]|nr:ABC transporter ATP-binding protein [Saprospiraceae bacterium]